MTYLLATNLLPTPLVEGPVPYANALGALRLVVPIRSTLGLAVFKNLTVALLSLYNVQKYCAIYKLNRT